MYQNVQLIAGMVGQMDQAETLIAEMRTRVTELEDMVATVDSHPVVFYEVDGTDPNAPWTSGSGTFMDTLISMAGGQNLGSAFSDPWVQISAEEILAQDPDIIILGDHNFGVTPEEVSARPGWDSLQAVQNERVYGINDDLISRPSPRQVEGFEELVKLIHPELFEKPD
jgi:iron complex transport system substrate-binding protein